MPRRPSTAGGLLAVVVVPVAIALFVRWLSVFEGGPLSASGAIISRPIPDEAVPMWRTPELHILQRFLFGYLVGKFFPVAGFTDCPTVVDWSDVREAEGARACMAGVRGVDRADRLVPLGWLFDTEVVYVDRPNNDGDDDPLKVTLLRKKNAAPKDDRSSGPLILYMHGGGFTLRAVKDVISARIFRALLGVDHENVMEDAAFAVVEYRLAPEGTYPAAANDCMLALRHLVEGKGLGGGGIHVAGSSAGATLAMETALRSLASEGLGADTMYVDEPVIPFPRHDDEGGTIMHWTMDSPSYRRYAYARAPTATWLEWSLKAYLGMGPVEGEGGIPYGQLPLGVDFTGGAATVSEWTKALETGKVSTLPRLFLVTAKGDPLRDGGLYFKDVYETVLSEVEAGVGEVAEVVHFDTRSGHMGHYLLEPHVFWDSMRRWYDEMLLVRRRKEASIA